MSFRTDEATERAIALWQREHQGADVSDALRGIAAEWVDGREEA